jgi:hypothetical protein
MGPADYPMYALHPDPVPLEPGRRTPRFTLPSSPSLQGVFSVSVAVMQPGTNVALDARRFGERIRVFGPIDYGLVPAEFKVDQLTEPPPPSTPRDVHADHGQIKARLAARAASAGGVVARPQPAQEDK